MAGKMNKKLFGISMSMEKWFFVLLAGVALLILALPSGKASEKEPENKVRAEKTVQTPAEEYHKELEERLKAALSQVEGVGKTEVMITLKSTEEKLVEKDLSKKEDTQKEQDSQGGSRDSYSYEEDSAVIFAEDENGNQVPYVVKEILPEIQGILVVCEGGDRASVQTEVYEAVEALLGVPAHKIKVLKKISETK